MGVNKLVMVKNKNSIKSYTYGNVAYDMQPEKESKIKRKARKVKKTNTDLRAKLKVIAMIGMIFVFSFLTISRFTVIISMSADVRGIKKEITKIQKENENIKVELATMDNIKKIEDYAVNKYGMVVPERNQIVYIDVKPLTNSSEETKFTAFQTIQKLLGLIY
jgi:cell division protein FtsL